MFSSLSNVEPGVPIFSTRSRICIKLLKHFYSRVVFRTHEHTELIELDLIILIVISNMSISQFIHQFIYNHLPVIQSLIIIMHHII